MKPLRFPAARLGCGLIRGDLPDGALEVGSAPELLGLHLATCLACQVDLGPSRSLARLLGELAMVSFGAPHDLPERVMAGLGGTAVLERRNRRALVGWSALSVSAAAAAAIVVAARRGRVAAAG